MRKVFTKLLFVNDNFYLKNKNGRFDKVKGIQLKTLELDFFLHQNKIKFWAVVDGISGKLVTKYYKSVSLAKAELMKNIGFKSPKQIESTIIKSLKKSKLSPRYRYIANPTRNVAN